MMELQSIPLHDILKVVIVSYLIKASYSVVLAWPVSILVNYVKRVTGIDVYDLPKRFTPFKYKNAKQGLEL
jgi:queuosine precursor transporter